MVHNLGYSNLIFKTCEHENKRGRERERERERERKGGCSETIVQ